MRIFRILLAVLASMGFFCTAWAAETADLGAIGQVELRKDLSYFSNGSAEAVSIPGGARLDVHPGVLQVHQGKVVLSGRLMYTVLPHEWSQRIIPYFNINLTPDQWQNLSSINMQMYQPDSPLYAMVRQAVMSWTGENVSNRGSQFTIRDFEPLRRMNYTREMIYTAGGRVSLLSDGLLIPLYARLYFLLRGTDVCTVLLLAGDGGRYPLIYAADDLISAAAPHLIVEKRPDQIDPA